MYNDIPKENVGLKFSTAIQIHNVFGNKHTNTGNIIRGFDDVISENSDYINVVKTCGSVSELDKNAINNSNKIIDFFSQLKNFIRRYY